MVGYGRVRSEREGGRGLGYQVVEFLPLPHKLKSVLRERQHKQALQQEVVPAADIPASLLSGKNVRK